MDQRIAEILEVGGYEELLPIQQLVLEPMLAGKSLMAEAPTGSGKTLSYLLPILLRMNGDGGVRYLIVAPTKELGSQITQEVKKYTESVLFLPDAVGRERQIENLRKKRPEILVGMASRLLELISLGKIKLHRLDYIIVDEGDKVLKRDGLYYMEKIVTGAMKSVPLAFFSATYRPVDLEVIKSLRPEAELLTSSEVKATVRHHYLMSDPKRKLENMFKVLRAFDSRKAIVFINRAEGVEGIRKQIGEQTREVFILHTDLDMQKRKAILERFRKAQFALLITTDVFSRGLDIPDTDCVIHYDLPRTGNIYTHRSGRTGRGFGQGNVISLVSEEEKGDFYEIRHMAKVHIGQMSFGRDGTMRFIKKPDSPRRGRGEEL